MFLKKNRGKNVNMNNIPNFKKNSKWPIASNNNNNINKKIKKNHN